MADYTPEQALKSQIEALESQLESNPIFRKLRVLRAALEALEAISAPEFVYPHPGHHVITVVKPVDSEYKPRKSASSIPEAAEMAISEVKHPLTTHQLVPLLPNYGKRVGGANPATSLSNYLSADKRLKSIVWRGKKAWWPSNRPLPDEPNDIEIENTKGKAHREVLREKN